MRKLAEKIMSWKTVELTSDLYTYDYFLTEYPCRLCWCQNGVKEISSRTSGDAETNTTIAEMIYACIGVDLSISPRPTKICGNCWSEVQNFSEFRSFCHTTQSKLYDILRVGSQNQELGQNNGRGESIEDYTASDDNGFSDLEVLELAAINTLFEDLNNKSDGKVEEPQPKRPRKIKKVRSDTYCSQCKTDLGSQDLFTQHNTNIHGYQNSLYKCFGCERAFKHRKCCIRHETENCKVLKNGYKCDICGKFLQKRRSFEIHLRAHQEDNVELPGELFKCKKCVKKFISMELLNEHVTIHERDKKNWVCDVSSLRASFLR